jgi:UDP-glucose 4-epimerase
MLVGAVDKITRELGWEPQRSLDQIIADAWEFAQAQRG